MYIPWICYERNFSEFHLSIRNQLVFNQRLQLFVQSPQPYFLVLKVNVFSQQIGKKTYEYLNSAEQITRNWNVDQLSVLLFNDAASTGCERVNGTHEWAHRPYQLLITAACTNTGGKMKGSHPRAADRCPFVHRPYLSQVTSFMQLGMLCRWRHWYSLFNS